MTEIIVIGHGGYAEGVRTNLEMVTGVPENMHFLNFTKDEDRADLEASIDTLLEKLKGKEILFCCDLPGATPFQAAAIRTASHEEGYRTVVGLNQMAYMEMAMDSSKTVAELARRAVETTQESVTQFP